MSSFAMRSRLAGLVNKAFLHSRVFSTAPIHREGISLRGFHNLLNHSQITEFVTAEGLRNVTKFSQAHAIARAEASLKAKDAHNCYLFFPPEVLAQGPMLENDAWKAQVGAALKIVEHEQRLAVLRAGIQALWLAVLYTDPIDPLKVGIAFRLPKRENPEEFSERLETVGLVRCALLVCSRDMDQWWESFAKGQGENFRKFG